MELGIWGDSITYGGSSEGWVGLLRKHLSPQEIDVYNRGICGDTSEDILKRFDVEANAIEPQTIIFAVGINDSKHPKGQSANKVSLEKFEENMDHLIASAQTKSKRVLIIGLTEVDESITSTFGSKFFNTDIYRYDDALSTIAQKKGLEFIPMRGTLDVGVDLEDGIHPTIRGYAKMFEVIATSFK